MSMKNLSFKKNVEIIKIMHSQTVLVQHVFQPPITAFFKARCLKLRKAAKDLRRKVLTRTKTLSPNTHTQFCRDIEIYGDIEFCRDLHTLWKTLNKKNASWGKKQCFV